MYVEMNFNFAGTSPLNTANRHSKKFTSLGFIDIGVGRISLKAYAQRESVLQSNSRSPHNGFAISNHCDKIRTVDFTATER